MGSPTLEQISEDLRFFLRFLGAVCRHYLLVAGGAIIGAVLLFFPQLYQGIRVSGLWLLFALLVVAAFLAWRDEHRKALALEQRMKSRIRVSCGRSVEKSVVTDHTGTWFRVRLDLEGEASIPNIEGSVIDLLQDDRKVPLQECLILTMYPGKQSPDDKNMRILHKGQPEFIDVVHALNQGTAHFPLKFYPASVPHETLLQQNHIYKITLNIYSQSHSTVTRILEFSWTGDQQTSDIRDVTPTSSTAAATVAF
jgi:hypothetical protein